DCKLMCNLSVRQILLRKSCVFRRSCPGFAEPCNTCHNILFLNIIASEMQWRKLPPWDRRAPALRKKSQIFSSRRMEDLFRHPSHSTFEKTTTAMVYRPFLLRKIYLFRRSWGSNLPADCKLMCNLSVRQILLRKSCVF